MTSWERKIECPNGCGVRILPRNMSLHLIACRRTPDERRALAERRRLLRGFSRNV